MTGRNAACGGDLIDFLDNNTCLSHVTIERIEDYIPGNCSILNIDQKHWVAVWTDDRHVYYFDSLAMPPPHDIGADVYSMVQLQPYGTRTCGWYCLWFLIHARRGMYIKEMEIMYKCLDKNYLNDRTNTLFRLN